jgi:3-dehydroquinate dehydratase-2
MGLFLMPELTHTSIGIGDAVKAIKLRGRSTYFKYFSRESFRHQSYISGNAKELYLVLG